jgi:nicotinamide-nucleotide amidase
MNAPLCARILIIGDEVLKGRVVDLNGGFLAKFCYKNGITLKGTMVIRDEAAEMKEALDWGFKDADIVFTTGGLGPTGDDLTKAVFAQYFGAKLVETKESVQLIEEQYQRFGREWNKRNSYHMIPENFLAINNPKGLAPGLGKIHQDKILLCAPGVPHELEAMAQEEFLPILKKQFSNRFEREQQVVMRTRGIPEEKIFFELCPDLWPMLETLGRPSSYPQIGGVDVVLSFAGDEQLALMRLGQLQDWAAKSPLASSIWQWGNTALPEFVLTRAKEKKLTIALAESCTGGLTASRLTDIPGSSDVFLGSIVSYANSAKENLLAVPTELIAKHGAVSEEVVKVMAREARLRFGSDLSVAFSGIAGPDGGTKEKPVGTVAIATSSAHGEQSATLLLKGDRLRLKLRFSEMGLFHLLDQINSL